MAIIGIDLGTTNSLAVAFKDGKSQLIPNEFGEYLTPSVVNLRDNQVTVGKLAKERLVTEPEQTAQLFKRDMGSNRIFKLGNQVFTPVDLSALVVKQLIADAERFLGEPIEEVVISVPAYFNDKQRRATKRIGQLLDVKVERLINEPSAAAIACHTPGEYETFVVFDFGGGTLDISVVDCFENVIAICAIAGDNLLGGSDFDQALARYFCTEQNLVFDELSAQEQATLLLASERIKLALQTQPTAKMKFVHEGHTYLMAISQETFGLIAQPILTRIRRVIARAVKESGFTAVDLTGLVLIGGSSMMPLLQDYIANMLNLPIHRLEGMDQLVAKGLGTYIAIKSRQEEVRNLVVTDICPFSLGIATRESDTDQKVFSKIIEKNTVLPVSASDVFSNIEKGQRQIKLQIYQGEALKLEDNLFLAEIKVDIPINFEHHEHIAVTFSYDINAMLYVEIEVLSTGKKYTYQILDDQEVQALTSSQHLEDIKRISVGLNNEPAYQAILERANRIYKESTFDYQRDLMRSLTNFIKRYQAAFNNIQEKHRLIQQMTRFLDYYEMMNDTENLDIFKLEDIFDDVEDEWDE